MNTEKLQEEVRKFVENCFANQEGVLTDEGMATAFIESQPDLNCPDLSENVRYTTRLGIKRIVRQTARRLVGEVDPPEDASAEDLEKLGRYSRQRADALRAWRNERKRQN